MFPTKNVGDSNIFFPFVITIELSKKKKKKIGYVKKKYEKNICLCYTTKQKGMLNLKIYRVHLHPLKRAISFGHYN